METLDTFLKTLTLTRTDAVAMIISAFLFYTLYKFLSAKVFIPYIALYEQREAASTGALDDAQDINRKAAKVNKEFEEKINDEKIKISKARSETISSLKSEIEKNIKSKESQVSIVVTQEREKIAAESTELNKKVTELSESLSADIVGKLQKEGTQKNA